jgi:cell division protein FtsI/penicillin-binding protein 2
MSRAFITSFRFGLMTAVILVCFGVLFYRLFDLHVLEHSELTAAAERSREKFVIEPARRGMIVDRQGNVLATTRTVVELGVDPQMVLDGDEAKLPALSQLINVPVADLEKDFTPQIREVATDDGDKPQPVRWVVLNPQVEESVYEKVAALGIKAVYGIRQYQRVYPGGDLAAHVLGYVTRIDTPGAKMGTPEGGIESAMDFYLRGQDGFKETELDGHHHELPQYTREILPTDGLNVELTIDQVLQYYAQDELQTIVKEYQPAGATIIIGDPSTGEILALANYPTYDPNHYWDFPMVNLKDRAISDVFEPGSTFKIVTAAAALNEGLVRPTDTFDCSKATIDYLGRSLKLPHDDEPHGVLTVSQIVAESSNRGAANIGVLLGAPRLRSYAWAFGFGQYTGIGLPGESRGLLNSLADFDRDSLMITRVPMGQSVAATALQVHQAMSTVANHGVLMKPYLVRRIFDAKGNTVLEFQPTPERRVISSQTVTDPGFLNDMLCAVVSPDGTASRAKLQDITVAGKTGTAQKIVDGKYSSDHHVATFSGYLPAERPRLVITVIVDDAKEHGSVAFGGVVSAPAFQHVAAEAVQYLGIQPQNGHENLMAMKGDNLDWIR